MWLTLGGGLVLAAVVAAIVYRDTGDADVDRPWLWTGIVFVSLVAAAVTLAIAPDVPLPGVLVIAVLGPVLYLLERDDARHGDEPADPRSLPDSDDRE